MGKFTKEMVDSYAQKLLIKLNDEENKMVLDEFESIDKDIDIINEIKDIESVEPMNYCLDEMNPILNNDVEEPSPSIEDLLRNSDDTIGREIEIVKVVG